MLENSDIDINNTDLNKGDLRVPPLIFAILGFDGGNPADLIKALKNYRENK